MNRSVIFFVGFLVFLLVLFLLPQPNFPSDKALYASCQNNLRQLGKLLMEYADNNNDYYPDAHAWNTLRTKNSFVKKFLYCPIKRRNQKAEDGFMDLDPDYLYKDSNERYGPKNILFLENPGNHIRAKDNRVSGSTWIIYTDGSFESGK